MHGSESYRKPPSSISSSRVLMLGNERLFQPIGRYTTLARASLEGKPAFVLEPGSPGARAYRNLAKEIAHELQLARAAA